MSNNQPWEQLTNLLCVRLDNMGDVLMCTPAIRALKSQVDSRRVTLLTSSAGAGIALSIPEIDDIIRFDAPWVKNSGSVSTEPTQNLIAKIHDQDYDAAVLFTSYSQNPLPAAMLCYLAGIPQVLGYCRENPYQLINNWASDPEPLTMIRHEVQRQIDLVGSIGARTYDQSLSLHVPADDYDQIRVLLADSGMQPNRPWLVLHPGASEPKRQYNTEDFIIAGKLLLQEGWQIVLTGTHDEAILTSAVQKQLGSGCFNIAGQLTLPELCALIGSAKLLISNNTGPGHIAAALQTPVVVLYAQTNPQHTPWMVSSKVLYFPVPAELKSKNQFLQHFPGPTTPIASPQAIVQAVHQLVAEGI